MSIQSISFKSPPPRDGTGNTVNESVVAMFCTHSDVAGMRRTAELFGETVIDVYGEMISFNPKAFDPIAVQLRGK